MDLSIITPEFFAEWFAYFLIYSFVGWVWEVIWCSAAAKKWQDRGFLQGPICPIYGCGALIFLYIDQTFHFPWYGTFLMIMAVCTVLEYLTSYLMEKIFHMRWWDYTDNTRFSLNGRVSLETSLGFGAGGMIVIYLAHPVISKFVGGIPMTILQPAAIVLLVFYLLDSILSWVAALKVRGNLKGGKIDLTAEIKKYTRAFYLKRKERRRKWLENLLKIMQDMQKQANEAILKMKKS